MYQVEFRKYEGIRRKLLKILNPKLIQINVCRGKALLPVKHFVVTKNWVLLGVLFVWDPYDTS